jgi:hypothetical protein
MLGQQPADAVERRADLGQISDQGKFLPGRCDSLLWIEGPSDLSVAVAVQPEGGPKKVQFTMQAFRVIDRFGPVYQCREYSLLLERMVVGIGVKVEARVSRFAVKLMVQGTIRFTVYISVKEGKMAVAVGVHHEPNVVMDVVQVVREL